MKATKKIVGAACALVAAVALSAGSTFAWFNAKNEATATGLTIKATTPANLAIVEGYKTNVTDVSKSTISMTDGNTNDMKPVAITENKPEAGTVTQGSKTGATVTGSALYVVEPATYTTEPTPGTKGTVATFKDVDEGSVDGQFKWKTKNVAGTDTFAATIASYVAGYNMTLANVGEAVNVTAEVAVTWGSNDNSHQFVRTGFLVGVSGSYKFYSIANENSDALASSGDKFTYTNLVSNFAGNSVVTITFLAWFDGDDTQCYLTNAINATDVGFNITYKASAVSGG